MARGLGAWQGPAVHHGLAVVWMAVPLLIGQSSGAPSSATGGDVTVQRGIEYRTVGGTSLLLDAHVPPVPGPRPAVILLHGGGWIAGSRSDPTNPVGGVDGQAWAEAGFVAFTIDYRLAPEFQYPAAVRDAQAAVRWVRQHAAEYDVDATRIAAFGHSAGGHLAAELGVLGTGPLDAGARVPVAVSWSGPLGLAECARTSTVLADAIAQFLGCRIEECSEQMAEASPISHIDAMDAAILVANSRDEFVPFAQAARMSEELTVYGVPSPLIEVPGSAHAGYGEVGIGPTRETVWELTIRFVRDQLGESDEDVEANADSGSGVQVLVLVLGAVAAAGAGFLLVRRRKLRG